MVHLIMQLRISFRIMFNDKRYVYTNISGSGSFPAFILQSQVSFVHVQV